MSLNSTLDRLEEIEASAASLGRDIVAAFTALGVVDPSDPIRLKALNDLIAMSNAWTFYYAGPEEIGKSGWRLYYENRRALLYKMIAVVKTAGGAAAAVVLGLIFPGFGGGLVELDVRTQAQAETYAARLRELYADFTRIGGAATTMAPPKKPTEDPSTLGKLGAALLQETAKQTKSALDTGRIIAFAALAIGAVYVVREVRK